MKSRRTAAAFTLVELLISAGVLLLILGLLIGMTNQTQHLVESTSQKVEQFQDSRAGFESMTRCLAQATLNTYWDYSYRTEYQTIGGKPVPIKVPDRYLRTADLRFRSGPMTELTGGRGPGGAVQPTHGIFFQAPNGLVADPTRFGVLDHLMNSWGYFVEYGSDDLTLPACLKGRVEARKRFRLLEYMEPAEQLKVYQYPGIRSNLWFAPAISQTKRSVRVLAENVVALILQPRFDRATEEARKSAGKSTILAPNYRYDTTTSSADPELNPKNQLPPVVQVTMVAIDEASAKKLAGNAALSSTGIDYGELFRQPEKYATDLAAFEKQLAMGQHVAYRVFTTNVSIRGAKWSVSQQN